MENHSKALRHKEKQHNYRVVGFGSCTVKDCPDNAYTSGLLVEHFHGLIYKKGRLASDEIEFMKYTLNQLGFVGELIAEYVTHAQLRAFINKEKINRIDDVA